MKQEHFFITGCQRSGTTLMRLILESHSQVRCLDELTNQNLMLDFNEASVQERLAQLPESHIGFKIPRFAEQLRDKYMSDSDFPSFPSFYANQKVIFLIRDPLDVITSMARLELNEGGWIEQQGRPILQHKRRQPKFESRYATELKLIDESPSQWELVAALYWRIKNEPLLEYLQEQMPVMALRYEDLVNHPRAVIASIVQALGLMWEDDLMSHHTTAHTEVDKNGFAIGNTDTRKPISTDSIGSHKDVLSEQQISLIHSITAPLEQQLSTIFEANRKRNAN